MNTSEAINSRRAVKHFDPSHEMTEEEIKTLFDSVLLSPTSFNIQHWRFVVVRDKALREQVKAKAWGQAQITDASLLVILTGDMKAYEKNPARYWEGAPKEASDVLVPMIGQYYGGREDVQRDEVMRSTGIAAQTLMLAAQELGYDSCPMVGFDYQGVAEIIKLPSDHLISMIVTVGKATKPAYARCGKLPYSEVVIRDRF
jgi:nitroreductase